MSARDVRLRTLRGAVGELRAERVVHPSREDVVRVAERLKPYLYDGTFATNLAKMSLFTEEQARESVVAKVEEHELEVEQVLLHYLNPPRLDV